MSSSFNIQPNQPKWIQLGTLAQLFLKLGTIGFGGPNVHIAMMEDEVVKQRQWLTQENFLNLLGATNLIPGPTSTQMAIHIGYLYAGWLGLIVSGLCFILPAIVITTLFAALYTTYGSIPQIAFLLYGIKPVVLAIILHAIYRLGQKALKNHKLWTIAITIAILLWTQHLSEIGALLLGGLIGMLWLQTPDRDQPTKTKANLILIPILTTTLKATATIREITTNEALWQLGKSFLKIGSILFGGGYVLMAFIQAEFVEQLGWLTSQQLLDTIAIGQLTPGPILSTATFIGYLIAGIPGSLIATIAIFLPSFLLVALLNPLIPHLRRSKLATAFLDAVNASSLALMAVLTLQLSITTLTKSTPPYIDWIGTTIAILSAILSIRFQINTIWLIIGGAFIGSILALH
jgi:chromate transporter